MTIDKRTSLLVIIFLLLGCLPARSDPMPPAKNKTVCEAQYGTATKCTLWDIMRFPDFDLEYLGEEPNGFYPGTTRRLAPVLLYSATKGSTVKKVKWSMGTGDIAPALFEINGKAFFLEIAGSEILDCKRDCGLVAWPKAEFEVKLNRKYEESN